MGIIISGANGIDMGNKPISNASQLDSTVINENGENVATTSNLIGFKNYIINGNFDIWQYKDAGLTYPQTSSGYGSADRWLNIHNGSTKIVSKQTTFAEGFNILRTVVSSVAGSTNYVRSITRIENLVQFTGKKLTLSFLVKADSNKKIGVSVTNFYGTGGAPSAQEDYATTVYDINTIFKKVTVTFDGPASNKTFGTNNDHYLQIQIWFDAGSGTLLSLLGQQSGTFDIAKVQLEEGSIATPFEQRPIGLELSLCQRYFEYETGGCAIKCEQLYDNRGATQFEGAIKFNVKKRVIPSINNVAFNSGSYSSIPRITTNGVIIQSTGSTVNTSVYISSYSADAEI